MKLSTFAKTAVSLIYPSRCALCGRAVPMGNDVCPECADSCERIPLPVCTGCGQTESGCECGAKTPYAAVVAPFYYSGAVAACISRFKFNGKTYIADFLGEQMSKAAQSVYKDKRFDCVTCVPGTKARLRERGYNQSELLAKRVARLNGIPFEPGMLKKMFETPDQRTLSASRRRGNLAGAFSATKQVNGKTVLLCDDVKTTGATVAECSRALLAAGAEEVCCLTAAITKNMKGKD